MQASQHWPRRVQRFPTRGNVTVKFFGFSRTTILQFYQLSSPKIHEFSHFSIFSISLLSHTLAFSRAASWTDGQISSSFFCMHPTVDQSTLHTHDQQHSNSSLNEAYGTLTFSPWGTSYSLLTLRNTTQHFSTMLGAILNSKITKKNVQKHTTLNRSQKGHLFMKAGTRRQSECCLVQRQLGESVSGNWNFLQLRPCLHTKAQQVLIWGYK